MSFSRINLEQLEKKLAKIEFMNDQLITEILFVDDSLKSIGFVNGLRSLKDAVKEILEQEE